MQFPPFAALIVAVPIAVAGCGKSSFESEPVVIQTEQGLVVCQLYTPERVMWDHAVSKPETMSQDDADVVCFAEGKRLQQQVRPRARPETKESSDKEPGFLGRFFGK